MSQHLLLTGTWDTGRSVPGRGCFRQGHPVPRCPTSTERKAVSICHLKTKRSHAGGSSMGWKKMAHSQCKEGRTGAPRKAATAPGAGSMPHCRAQRRPASWQPRNNHGEAFCPLAALLFQRLEGPQEAEINRQAALFSRRGECVFPPHGMILGIRVLSSIMQSGIDLPANSRLLSLLALAKHGLFHVLSLSSAKCAPAALWKGICNATVQLEEGKKEDNSPKPPCVLKSIIFSFKLMCL